MKLEDRILEKGKSKKSGWHQRTLGLYHASEIYNICEGKLKPEDFFKQEEYGDKTIFNFWIGNMYHDAVQRMYPKAKKEVPIEIEIIENEARIIGRCDMVTECPIELKTCSKFPIMPYDSHKYQFNCYLYALDADSGFIVYILKDSQEVKTLSFKYDYDADLMKYVKNKVSEFHEELINIKNKKEKII